MPAQPDTPARRPARRNRGARTWGIAAVVLTSMTSLALMLLPTITTAESSGGIEQTSRQSLLENQGWTVAAILAVPVLISAAPLLVPTRHRLWPATGSAILLAGGGLLAAASVGLFYLPSAALLAVAAATSGTDANARQSAAGKQQPGR